MSNSTDSCHDLDMTEPKGHQNILYSPTSGYSTYSRDIKYIFNPLNENRDEEKDYSRIHPNSKYNNLSYTPNAPGVSSHLSGKDSKTPHTTRDEHMFDSLQNIPTQYIAPARTNSGVSNVSRVRAPMSSHIEETPYSSTRGYGLYKPNPFPDRCPGDRSFFSPSSEIIAFSYAKNAQPVLNNYVFSQHPQSLQTLSNCYNDIHNKNNRSNEIGVGLHAFQNQTSLTNTDNFHHYQQPHVHQVVKETSYPQESHNQGQDPPYPMPPRYNYQHHSRRKTWSPPVLIMGLANSSSHGSRVCFSNNSLDVADEGNTERNTQSLSEELDMTPPKLAPVSGVLAQKPGQNLIRPVAFKPLHNSSALSPVGHVTRRQPGTDNHVIGSHDTTRYQGIKPGTDILIMQESPEFHRGRPNIGAFSSMAKFQFPNPGGVSTQTPINLHQSVDSVNHSYPLVSYCQTADVDNSLKGSQQNVSLNSHHSISNNSYSNIPVNFQITVNSSHAGTGDETSISSEFPSSDRPDSIPSLNISRVSSHAVEGILQTPSPSDSGVGELEAMLREKDAEINTLREVMERNERAIFQVYEERRNVWFHETQELQNEYERRLKVQSRKSYKTEQVLSHQVYKLQQEQKLLQEDTDKIINERDFLKQQVDESQNLITHLKQKLESVMNSELNSDRHVTTSEETEQDTRVNLSLQEELTLKNKDVIFLKTQLNSFQADMERKNKELADTFRDLSAKTEEVQSLKDQLLHLRDAPTFIETSTQTVTNELTASENARSSTLDKNNQNVNDLQEQQLVEIRKQMTLLKDEHEKEMEQWLDEKNKVIRYQKQLQLNYVQMQRKNVALENEVQQLTMELEHRDMKLIALSGEESVC